MQFDSFEKFDVTVPEVDLEKKLYTLHQGFDCEVWGTFEYCQHCLSVSDSTQYSLANTLGWEKSAVTPELLPSLFDSAKEMIKGTVVDGKLTCSLEKISKWHTNDAFSEQNKRQHAGYAAELISTWKENAQALKDGTGVKTMRVDDLSEDFKKHARELGINLKKNDPYVDKIRVNANGDIVEKIQSKFVGGDAKGCLQKLVSSKYDKYFLDGIVDTVEIPNDFYDDVKKLIIERRAGLEKQIERLKTIPGKEDVLVKKSAQLDRLNIVDEMIKKSTVKYDEARFAVDHPKLFTTKMFADQVIDSGHGMGVETGLEAVALTSAVSTVDNVQKYMAGEITALDAVKDITNDVSAAGFAGYGTGFVEGVIANSMSASSHAMLTKMAKAGVPGAIVTFGVESFDITVDFAKGEIDANEFAYELGKNAASVTGGVVGGMLLSNIPCGQTVGSIVGCAVASEAYVTAVEYGGKGAEILADKAQEMATKTIEMAKIEVPDKVDVIRDSISVFVAENNIPIKI